MSPAAIAALAAAALAAGVLLIVTGLVGTRRPAAPQAPSASRLAIAFGVGLSTRHAAAGAHTSGWRSRRPPPRGW